MPDQQDPTRQSDNARQPVVPRAEVTREHRAIAVDFLFPRTPKAQRDCWVGGGTLDSGHWRRAEFTAIHDLAELLASREAASVERGRLLERTEVVSWLRRDTGGRAQKFASAIERGDHLAQPKESE